MSAKATSLILAASLLLLAPAARADLTENQPGGMCVATGSSKLYVRTDGEAQNNDYAAVTAVCPVARPMSPFASKISGKVFVVDRHPTENVCCYVASKNPGGKYIKGSTVCSSGSSSGYKVLDLPELQDGYSWSHFYISCTLPAKYSYMASRIMMYRSIQR